MKCNCGTEMIFRTGVYGGFYACTNCRKTQSTEYTRYTRKPFKNNKHKEESLRAEYTSAWCDTF